MTESGPPTLDRLLLVDDNPANLQVLFSALQEEGYELLVAQSGEEALQTARNARPQLILLDINMPGMDGYDTCRALKADPQTSQCAVIFLSARGSVDDKVQGLELGAVDYIEKPFQFEEVVARVRQHLATWHQHRRLKHENKRLKNSIDGGFREFDEDDIAVLLGQGESDRLEFKSTLRWNLHTNKPDKKLENACLKTVAAYLNTSGGVLLVGVDDAGQPLGLDTDNFDNEDKLLLHWNGLVKQYLGVEVTPRVQSTIYDAGSRRLLGVQVLPSGEPVFFRRDNDESFFVRTGNGTHALKPSEVLRYLEERSSTPP
ncbi:MAG: response regulator [Pirellulaceae bacterium]